MPKTIIIIIIGIIIATVLGYWLYHYLNLTPSSSSQQTMVVEVYFGNTTLNPNLQDCRQVHPVERNIPKTLDVARVALEELFKGPTEEERNQGYVSWFSEKTKNILKSVKVENNIAYVDLKDIRQIIPNISTSCGSAEFLAEVETTLKQFPDINRVIIAIDGKPSTFYEWIQIGCAKENDFCDETPFENWQTYQSSRGFSFKCPDTFSGYLDLPNDTTAYQDGLKSGCIAKDNGLASIEIVSWTKFTEEVWGKDFTLNDFLKNEIEIIRKSDFEQEEIVLNNNPAIKITYTENLGADETRKITNIYFQEGELMYRIHIVILPQIEARYTPVINKILSTFKFIELADNAQKEFCGVSTYGNCSSDSDCVIGGCSAQVCQSKNEEPVVTTCEYKDCYKSADYGLKCGCLTKKCQWFKK